MMVVHEPTKGLSWMQTVHCGEQDTVFRAKICHIVATPSQPDTACDTEWVRERKIPCCEVVVRRTEVVGGYDSKIWKHDHVKRDVTRS